MLVAHLLLLPLPWLSEDAVGSGLCLFRWFEPALVIPEVAVNLPLSATEAKKTQQSGLELLIENQLWT